MNIDKNIWRCKELIKEEHSNWIGLTNQEAIDNVLNELYKYKMIADRLAEKLELLIISIYHKEEILALNTNKVKEYYENNKSIKAALIKECEEELVCFIRERGRR